MSKASAYYVYILASGQHGTLYIGVTNNVRTQLELHRIGRGSKFVQQYKVYRLVTLRRSQQPSKRLHARSS